MATFTIDDRPALTGASSASDDYFLIWDASAGTHKKISRAELSIALAALPLAGGTLSGPLIIANVGSDVKFETQRTGGKVLRFYHEAAACYLYNQTDGVGLLLMKTDGTEVRPTLDNTATLGNGSARWSVVYAGTGTINTSDAREKTEPQPLAPELLAFFRAVARDVVTFQYLASVAEKGVEHARHHVGWVVQRIIAVGATHGFDEAALMRFGFIGKDAVTVGTDDAPVIDVETGLPTFRYSVRMDQLLAGCIAALASELAVSP